MTAHFWLGKRASMGQAEINENAEIKTDSFCDVLNLRECVTCSPLSLRKLNFSVHVHELLYTCRTRAMAPRRPYYYRPYIRAPLLRLSACRF